MDLHTASSGGEGGLLAASSARPAPVHGLAASLAAAGLVAGGVLAGGSGGPLPATAWAAAFLFLVVLSDVRRLRIPNWLTFPALLAAVLHQAVLGAGPGVALAGAGCALLILLPAWLGGFMGAGDVKAAMPLGALWGAPVLITVLIWSALLAGAFGLVKLAAAGALGDLASRWRASLVTTLLTRRPTWIPPAPDSAAAQVVPFGCVLGAGAVATLFWGAAWA